MISNSIIINIVDGPDKAPDYKGTDFTLLRMTKAIIVKNGTVSGNPTVDIQLYDEHGNNFLIMATGGIIENLAAALMGIKS